MNMNTTINIKHPIIHPLFLINFDKSGYETMLLHFDVLCQIHHAISPIPKFILRFICPAGGAIYVPKTALYHNIAFLLQ